MKSPAKHRPRNSGRQPARCWPVLTGREADSAHIRSLSCVCVTLCVRSLWPHYSLSLLSWHLSLSLFSVFSFFLALFLALSSISRMRKSQSHRVKTSQKENGKHFRSFFLATILSRLDLISLYHRPVTVCFWCGPGSHLRVRLCVYMTKSFSEILFTVFFFFFFSKQVCVGKDAIGYLKSKCF